MVCAVDLIGIHEDEVVPYSWLHGIAICTKFDILDFFFRQIRMTFDVNRHKVIGVRMIDMVQSV